MFVNKIKSLTLNFLSCSCTDTICGDETMKSEPAESHYVVLDSLAIYKIQTDKSMMLNNLIRYQSGKYLLDLSLDDAKKK